MKYEKIDGKGATTCMCISSEHGRKKSEMLWRGSKAPTTRESDADRAAPLELSLRTGHPPSPPYA